MTKELWDLRAGGAGRADSVDFPHGERVMPDRSIGQESWDVVTPTRLSSSLDKLPGLVDWGRIATLLEPL